MAPYPSGKGEVCKTFMHRFESDRRLFPFFNLRLTLQSAYLPVGVFGRTFPLRQSRPRRLPARVVSLRRTCAVPAGVRSASPCLALHGPGPRPVWLNPCRLVLREWPMYGVGRKAESIEPSTFEAPSCGRY